MVDPNKNSQERNQSYLPPIPPTLSSPEYRSAPRFAVEQAAVLVSADDGREFPCTILNISRSGALIKFENLPVPEFFNLRVSGHDFDHFSMRVWVKSNLAGVQFNRELTSLPGFAQSTDQSIANQQSTEQAETVAASQINRVAASSAPSPSAPLVEQQAFPLSMPNKAKPKTGFGKRRNPA